MHACTNYHALPGPVSSEPVWALLDQHQPREHNVGRISTGRACWSLQRAARPPHFKPLLLPTNKMRRHALECRSDRAARLGAWQVSRAEVCSSSPASTESKIQDKLDIKLLEECINSADASRRLEGYLALVVRQLQRSLASTGPCEAVA